MFSGRQLFIVMNLLLILLSAAAGAAHITDKLVVGIYADPGVDGSPLKLLSSGTPLEVLQRKDGFVEIRLSFGMGVALIDYRIRKRYGGVRI